MFEHSMFILSKNENNVLELQQIIVEANVEE